ncbi:MAG: DUF7541 family protein [Natronomonas sp.]
MEAESEPEPESALSERYAKSSPWPVVVALGLVVSEIGILFGLYPVAVAGLVMFAGSVSGIVYEAGYVASPWRLLSGLGIVFVALGLALVSTQVDGGLSAYLAQTSVENGVTLRGFTVAATGAIITVGGIVAPRATNQ